MLTGIAVIFEMGKLRFGKALGLLRRISLQRVQGCKRLHEIHALQKRTTRGLFGRGELLVPPSLTNKDELVSF